MNLKHLTDKSLLSDTKYLVTKERETSTAILYHLKEIERRRLFSDLGYESLFDYAVRELKYSEPSASRRINAARLLADMPELRSKIESGVFSLCNLSQIAHLFKKEEIKDLNQKREIIEKIENKSKRECEKALLEFSEPRILPKESNRIVTPDFHTLRINISSKTNLKLEELKKIAYDLSFDQLMDLMISATISKLLSEKFKLKPSKTGTPPVESQSGKRSLSASMKRDIYTRDLGKCQKCGGTFKLEFDHLLPFALGGKTNKENLRLLCFSCNQRARIRASL